MAIAVATATAIVAATDGVAGAGADGASVSVTGQVITGITDTILTTMDTLILLTLTHTMPHTMEIRTDTLLLPHTLLPTDTDTIPTPMGTQATVLA